MLQLLENGKTMNIPIKQYYAESEEEVAQIPSEAPVGSTVLILKKDGLSIKMKHSDGSWVTI